MQVLVPHPFFKSFFVSLGVYGSRFSRANFTPPPPPPPRPLFLTSYTPNRISLPNITLCTGTSGPNACPLYFAVSIGEGAPGALWSPMLLCALAAVSRTIRVKLRNSDFKTLRVKGTSPNVDVTCLTQSPHVDFVEWLVAYSPRSIASTARLG